MAKNSHKCLVCGSLLVEVEAALNRTFANALLSPLGSSQLQIRRSKSSWMPFMNPARSAEGLYCPKCGSLTLAPSIPNHRKDLGLDE